MDVILSIAAFVLSILGIVGCIVPIIPGVAFSYIALLCAYLCSYSSISSTTLFIWLAITIFVCVIDYLLPAYMSRLFGGSRSGAIGATVGMIAGMIFFNIPGVIIGPFVGAVLGELLNNKKDINKAFKVGFGSFLSFAVGTGLKFVAAVWMFVLLFADTYPVVRDWALSIF